MKFLLNVEGRHFVLTAEQLDQILPVLNTCEEVHNKWAGSGKGDNGSDYNRVLRAPNTQPLTVQMMSENDYGLLKFLQETRDKNT